MAYATGTRLAAFGLFIIGLVTVVGSVFCWPIAYLLVKRADQKEREREQELEAVGASA